MAHYNGCLQGGGGEMFQRKITPGFWEETEFCLGHTGFMFSL